MIKRSIATALIAFSLVFSSCSDNDDDVKSTGLTLDISGLEDLGNDYVYEGWIIVNGAPITTGVFSVDADNGLSETVFNLDSALLASATEFVLTIEPRGETGVEAATPSKTKYLQGTFSGTSATLSTGIIADFSAVWGKYILATPSDDNADNDFNGIWWLTQPGPEAGLGLPTLAEGWVYEGWVVTENGPITTGTFTDVAMADKDGAGPTAGSNGTPPFPGQDFINPAIDVRGKTAVISIEPYPDNNAAPFTLKPLVGTVGQDIAPVSHTMNSNVTASFPSGSVWR